MAQPRSIFSTALGSLTRPESPWAQRFGFNTGSRLPLIDDGLEHSGLAPKLPALHPKYYADRPPYDRSPPTKQQMDHMFVDENFQKSYLEGLASWEAGPLMRYVWLTDKIGVMSGGHHASDYGPIDPTAAPGSAAAGKKEDDAMQIFNTYRIQVDERKWYSFLQRSRWYDLQKPEPALGGGNWSVDNPKVWDVLSISLELVDRMLKALISDKNEWIETLLFGLLMDYNQLHQSTGPSPSTARLLLSRQYHKAVCTQFQQPCALDSIPMTIAFWTQRLENMLQKQRFSFADGHDNSDSPWGVTMHDHDGFIVLDVGPLKRLIRDDLTLSERCIIHYGVAVTMLHELFHSIVGLRKLEDMSTWNQFFPPINWATQFTQNDSSLTQMVRLRWASPENNAFSVVVSAWVPLSATIYPLEHIETTGPNHG